MKKKTKRAPTPFATMKVLDAIDMLISGYHNKYTMHSDARDREVARAEAWVLHAKARR